MNYATTVKNTLISTIDEMCAEHTLYVNDPEKDFSRNRKMSFRDNLLFPIVMESGTIRHELFRYFSYDENTLSNSAYCQQRDKIRSDTFKTLFINFNSHFRHLPYKKDYQLIAVDGSSFTFTRNPSDKDSFYEPNDKSSKGYNQIHVVASYDISNKRYLDAVIQPVRKKNEFQAMADLIDAHNAKDLKPVFIADRGFFSYNVFAHAFENNAFFLIRGKELNVQRLIGSEMTSESFDIDITRFLSRTRSKKKHSHPESEESYRYICSTVPFDFIPKGSSSEYTMTLRVLRFKITEDSYEYIVTNLPREEFTIESIKHLYNLRWGIETSFRELKHILGAGKFHSKKRNHIEQEIWARFILYNFCSIITAHVVIKKCNRKYEYQVNFTVAYQACHYFIGLDKGEGLLNIESLIGKNILPIRPNRNYARQHKFRNPVSFTYRH